MNKLTLFAILSLLALGTMANKCEVSNTPGTPSQTDEQKSAPAPAPTDKPAQ